MDHEHKALISAKKKIVGGGSIAIETCKCKAMRSVIEHKDGTVINGDWETEDEPQEDMPLLWDGTTHNDNEDN